LIWGWHWRWGPFGGWGPTFIFSFTDVYIDAVDVIDYDYDNLDDYEVDMADYADYDLDLDVDIDDTDVATMDEYLDESDFEVNSDDMMDFSADDLAHEGTMDVTDYSDFEDHDFGGFDEGAFDTGGFDLDF
jgi:hypothetical protein